MENLMDKRKILFLFLPLLVLFPALALPLFVVLFPEADEDPLRLPLPEPVEEADVPEPLDTPATCGIGRFAPATC